MQKLPVRGRTCLGGTCSEKKGVSCSGAGQKACGEIFRLSLGRLVRLGGQIKESTGAADGKAVVEASMWGRREGWKVLERGI